MGRKTYNQSQFRRVLKSKTVAKFKKDDCDLLIYLIQVKFLAELMNGDGDLTTMGIEQRHKELMKKYRG